MRLWIPVGFLKSLVGFVTFVGSVALVAGSAAALPGISLSEPLPEVGADECPVLTQIKYPWLQCATNERGGRSITSATVSANASWQADRSLPLGDAFVEGDGWWAESPQ